MIRWIGPDPLPPRDFGRLTVDDRGLMARGLDRPGGFTHRASDRAGPDPMMEIGRFAAILGGGLTGAAGVYGLVYATVWSMMNSLGA